MKLSTRATYGVRALLALSRRYGEGPLMVREIAEREKLPATYLEQIMVPLRRARLVSATRGAGGGYVLTRSPNDITLAEAVETLEGTLAVSDCPAGTGCCSNTETCVVRELWESLSDAIRKHLGEVTLGELLERQQAKDSAPALMYII